jgi:hypothetical protein
MRVISKIERDHKYRYPAQCGHVHRNSKHLHEQYTVLEHERSFQVDKNTTQSWFRRGVMNDFTPDQLTVSYNINHATYNKVLVLQTAFQNNYCHNLIDNLQTLMYHDQYTEADHIFTGGSQLMKNQIETLGIKLNKTTLIDQNEQCLFNTKCLCIYNVGIKRHIKKATMFKNHVDKYIDNNFEIPTKPRLIYCSRNHSKDVKHGRKMSQENENEIIMLLKQYCEENDLTYTLFTGMESGHTMPLVDQLKLFRQAKIVVGPHGGAMSNVIYLDPTNNPRVCEFTGGTQVQVHANAIFGKNYNNLNAHLFDEMYDYCLIPFAIGSTSQLTTIDIDNLKKFLTI